MSEVVEVPDDDEVVDPSLLTRLADLLDAGELVVVPTDTVYGVLANPFTADGPDRLHAARGTDRSTPLPILVATTWQVGALAEVGEQAQRLMDAFWPGPLTLLLRANESTSWDIGESAGTVAVRMPSEPLVRELLRRTGPLACTSACPVGEAPPATAVAARQALADAVAVYVDAGTRDARPSTVVDTSRGGAEVRRLGAVSADDVFRVATAAGPAAIEASADDGAEEVPPAGGDRAVD